MLDLNKLEQKLDEALENETTESLIGWIMKRKAKALFNSILEQIRFGFCFISRLNIKT